MLIVKLQCSTRPFCSSSTSVSLNRVLNFFRLRCINIWFKFQIVLPSFDSSFPSVKNLMQRKVTSLNAPVGLGVVIVSTQLSGRWLEALSRFLFFTYGFFAAYNQNALNKNAARLILSSHARKKFLCPRQTRIKEIVYYTTKNPGYFCSC